MEKKIIDYKQKQYNTDCCGVFITFENDKDVKLA
jgi:hypothetical protein